MFSYNCSGMIDSVSYSRKVEKKCFLGGRMRQITQRIEKRGTVKTYVYLNGKLHSRTKSKKGKYSHTTSYSAKTGEITLETVWTKLSKGKSEKICVHYLKDGDIKIDTFLSDIPNKALTKTTYFDSNGEEIPAGKYIEKGLRRLGDALGSS